MNARKKMTTQIGLYIGNDLSKKVQQKCNKDEMKLSEVVRTLLRKWISGKVEI